MIFQKKNRFKPLYKQFFKIYENVQNRSKLIKFKKLKWTKLKKRLSYRSRPYIKFRPQNQLLYLVSKYPDRWNSYKRRYKNTLQTYKKFKLFYGNFTQKKMKKFIIQTLKNKKKTNNLKLIFLKLFESRLDTILYRAKFSKSIRTARQLIIHGKILVNNKKITSQSYLLTPGDLISINFKNRKFIESSIANSKIWPIPPKHLSINYKTLQIIVNTFSDPNLSSYYQFNFNLEKLLNHYHRI